MVQPQKREEKEEGLAALMLLFFAQEDWMWWYEAPTTSRWFEQTYARTNIPRFIRDTSRESYREFARHANMPVDGIIAESIAQDLAERRISEIAARNANRFGRWRDRVEPPDFTNPYTEHEISVEAVTTITDIWSQTEFRARDQFPTYYSGQRLVAYWMTEPGACSICEPLHGQPEEYWSLFFPHGPTAHPNCRCWLHWALEI